MLLMVTMILMMRVKQRCVVAKSIGDGVVMGM
ncbi:hypothetical protein CDBH8_1609 [Corynebacterium diphtheriae BH8]|nr:hypothetical protein CDBH8_1609 [Corynebacterium diphtheriae BH8]AEX79262.1 hypothetical protein CDHC03_1535 [Corynebacterium diphtheriae HC03]AEX81526.1 hypothetical protein CDHC04_1535 [Corynebacterium diphtheriae HC04]AEX83763.1 hypothetical protein CDVA01_1496 [Corynebacterium diphtheriae VA01]